jgi:mono/diheme cytochrome c family protein
MPVEETKMRQTLPAMLLVVTSTLIVPGRAGNAELQTGKYKPAELGNLQQMPPPELSPDSNFAVSAYPLYPPELAPGEGKQETEAYCALCHSTRYITMQPPLPAATWEGEVNKMNKAFGANIPEEVSQKILKYLQTHYTPETRK